MAFTKDCPIDLPSLTQLDAKADDLWAYGSAFIANTLYFLAPGSQVRYENLEGLPEHPVIVATNHTQFYDFMPLRAPLLFQGHSFVSWVKARAYRSWRTASYLSRVGCVPICSRGYILAGDFFGTLDRRPTEDEYRKLRDHVDKGVALPKAEPYLTLQNKARSILGAAFDPGQTTYANAIRELFYQMMMLTIEKTQEGVERGDHVHIYPQGSIAQRLIPGKTGVIEAALALDLPILAVGINGCRESFWGKTPVIVPRKKTTVRFDTVLTHVNRSDFPPEYRPFHPDDTDAYRPILQRYTDRVMERLNTLLDADHQWAPDRRSDAKSGVARFF